MYIFKLATAVQIPLMYYRSSVYRKSIAISYSYMHVMSKRLCLILNLSVRVVLQGAIYGVLLSSVLDQDESRVNH